MGNEIFVRQARPDDYFEFRVMEEAAWKDTGVEVISEEVFNTWIKVFPEGALLAIVDDRIRAHIFSQICDFYPDDHKDDRCWAEITDNGTAEKTHNLNGNAFYVVSISSRFSGSAASLINESIKKASQLKKNFFVGACRIPGISGYQKEKNIKKLTYRDVMKYASLVNDTVKERAEEEKRYYDPVLSTFLSIRKKHSKVCRAVEDYFPDRQSYNWACLISFEISKEE